MVAKTLLFIISIFIGIFLMVLFLGFCGRKFGDKGIYMGLAFCLFLITQISIDV